MIMRFFTFNTFLHSPAKRLAASPVAAPVRRVTHGLLQPRTGSPGRLWAGLLVAGLALAATPAQAQVRPKQFQIPTTFDSVYTKKPVRMVHFIAWEFSGGAQIEWVTLHEDKIKEFVVQCSTDGKTWQHVGTMGGNPGSKVQRNYTLYDSNIRQYGVPVLYYRVQETGKKGHLSYSPVRSIRLTNPDTLWRTPTIPDVTGGISKP